MGLLLAALTLLAACNGAGPGETAGTGDPGAGDGSTAGGDSQAPGGGEGGGEMAEQSGGDVAWTLAAPAPIPLTEVAGAAHQGRLWVAGGFDANGASVADVQVYDPAEDRWTAGPPLPEARHHAALVSTGEDLYLIGGYATPNFEVPSSRVWVLDEVGESWVEGPGLPAARAAGAAAFDGGRIVYGGGIGPGGLAGDVLGLVHGQWEPIGTLGIAREHLAAAGDGAGRVFFLAGRTGGFDTNLAAVDVVEGDEVRPLGDLPTPRGGLSGFYAPGIGACAAGGEGTKGTFTEVECMDRLGVVRTLPDLVEGRHGIGAAVEEGTAYVLLGGPEPGLTVSGSTQVLRLPAAGDR